MYPPDSAAFVKLSTHTHTWTNAPHMACILLIWHVSSSSYLYSHAHLDQCTPQSKENFLELSKRAYRTSAKVEHTMNMLAAMRQVVS